MLMRFLHRCARLGLPVAALVLIAALPTPGQAAQLWYNGDYDSNDSATNQNKVPINNGSGYTLNQSLVFCDFVVGANQTWTLSSVFSKDQLAYYIAPTTAYWEIRSGMSAGKSGTLVASGDTTATATLLNPSDGNNYIDPEYQISAAVTGVTLQPGVYYLAIAPDSIGYYGDQSYIETTSGANAMGTPLGNNGNSFLFNNLSGTGQNYYTASSLDYSMGVNGIINPSVVPEPASWLLMAAGLGTLAGYSGRSRRTPRPGA